VKEPFLPFGGEGIIALKNKKIHHNESKEHH
jgi:hypothetical protein